MPRDLKTVEVFEDGSVRPRTWPYVAVVDGEYGLVQRIVMNLLTNPGDDLFDPEWGAGLSRAIRGIPGQELELARKAVSAAVAKCAEDLAQATAAFPPEGRLLELSLEDLHYDPERAAWVCGIDVVTAANAHLVIKVPFS